MITSQIPCFLRCFYVIFGSWPYRLAWLGHRPFTAVTRVQISLGLLEIFMEVKRIQFSRQFTRGPNSLVLFFVKVNNTRASALVF